MNDQIHEASAPNDISQEIHTIASRQKVIVMCILVQIIAVFGQCFLPPELGGIVILGVLGVGVVSTVFVFMLAAKLYGTGVGVLLGVFTLIPIIGLIVLLVVNGRATKTLREHGVSVGLLGADMSTMPRR